jgi:Recombination endonuclease VII
MTRAALARKKYRALNRTKVNAQIAAWKAKNPTKVRALRADWYSRHTEQEKTNVRAWQVKNIQRVKINRRNRQWRDAGILNADGSQFKHIDYDRAYQVQQGKCLGCGRHQTELKSKLQADHDHKTGIFRFLLCGNCNPILGHAHDNPKVLRCLADLLEAMEQGE